MSGLIFQYRKHGNQENEVTQRRKGRALQDNRNILTQQKRAVSNISIIPHDHLPVQGMFRHVLKKVSKGISKVTGGWPGVASDLVGTVTDTDTDSQQADFEKLGFLTEFSKEHKLSPEEHNQLMKKYFLGTDEKNKNSE